MRIRKMVYMLYFFRGWFENMRSSEIYKTGRIYCWWSLVTSWLKYKKMKWNFHKAECNGHHTHHRHLIIHSLHQTSHQTAKQTHKHTPHTHKQIKDVWWSAPPNGCQKWSYNPWFRVAIMVLKHQEGEHEWWPSPLWMV